MNGPCMPRRRPVLREVHEPVRAMHGKRPPLEARPDVDPWLPLTRAPGAVSGPLHAFALAVLAIAALFFMAMLMMALASL